VQPFELDTSVAALFTDGSSRIIQPGDGGPVRIEGFTVGAPLMTCSAPHRGELHPDGDELLYLISGHVEVVFEEDGTPDRVGVERSVTVQAGQAIVVPAGVWHRVVVTEPAQMIHITPGPGSDHRPL
jgi:mannose-6-phosphate isomerase-like protein (cupin superfamily)